MGVFIKHGDQTMIRETILGFTALVAAAFIVRNAHVIIGLAVVAVMAFANV